MQTLKEKGLANIKKINFIPDSYLKTISEWIENIHDWSISRSLWWGHRIPVWYCAICNEAREVGKNKDMIVSMETPGKSCDRCGKKQWVQGQMKMSKIEFYRAVHNDTLSEVQKKNITKLIS